MAGSGADCESVTVAVNVFVGLGSGSPVKVSAGIGPQLTRCDVGVRRSTVSPSIAQRVGRNLPPAMVQLSSVRVLAVHSSRELLSSSVSGSTFCAAVGDAAGR